MPCTFCILLKPRPNCQTERNSKLNPVSKFWRECKMPVHYLSMALEVVQLCSWPENTSTEIVSCWVLNWGGLLQLQRFSLFNVPKTRKLDTLWDDKWSLFVRTKTKESSKSRIKRRKYMGFRTNALTTKHLEPLRRWSSISKNGCIFGHRITVEGIGRKRLNHPTRSWCGSLKHSGERRHLITRRKEQCESLMHLVSKFQLLHFHRLPALLKAWRPVSQYAIERLMATCSSIEL